MDSVPLNVDLRWPLCSQSPDLRISKDVMWKLCIPYPKIYSGRQIISGSSQALSGSPVPLRRRPQSFGSPIARQNLFTQHWIGHSRMSLGLTDTRETNIRGYLVERFDARPASVGAHYVTAWNRNAESTYLVHISRKYRREYCRKQEQHRKEKLFQTMGVKFCHRATEKRWASSGRINRPMNLQINWETGCPKSEPRHQAKCLKPALAMKRQRDLSLDDLNEMASFFDLGHSPSRFGHRMTVTIKTSIKEDYR